MRSIRRSIAIPLIVGIVGVTAIAGFALYARARDAMLEQFDIAIAAKARSIGAQLELDGSRVEFHYVPGLLTEFEGGGAPEYFQLTNSEGTVLERSDTLGDATLPTNLGPTTTPAHYDLALPDGREGRACGILLLLESPGGRPDASQPSPDRRPRLGVVVARSREELDQALASMRVAFGVTSASFVLAILSIVGFATARGLAPLSRLAASIATIDESRLDRRLDREDLPAELAPIATKTNDLLDRLSDAFLRERRMTGNLAHELRTPVAELRAAVDVARHWPDDPDLRAHAMEVAKIVGERMTTSISALLRLSRIRAGAAAPELASHSLAGVIATSIAPARRAAADRGIGFVDSTDMSWFVWTDLDLLAVAVSNLAENAARFATTGTTIESSARREDDGKTVVWSITNATAPLSVTDTEKLTEPFWQDDSARTDGHSGLGLALARAAVESIGSSLEFRIGERFEVRVRLVLAPPPPISALATDRNGTATPATPRRS